MTPFLSADVAATRAAEIVVAFLGNQRIEAQDLAPLVRQVVQALHGDAAQARLEPIAPSSEPVVQTDVVASLEAPEPPQATARPRLVAAPQMEPAVAVADSVTPEWIYSLEDGKPYRSLRRHLMAKYGMTPDDYRRKWGLPANYPMVAPSYAEQRSQVAKRSGLGTRAKPDSAPRASQRTAKRRP